MTRISGRGRARVLGGRTKVVPATVAARPPGSPPGRPPPDSGRGREAACVLAGRAFL